MWTPRRVVLLLGGLLLFGGAYAGYNRVLGWLDGLPQIPTKFLQADDGKMRPPDRPTSPTVEKLKEAFGPDCPELSDQNYPMKLEFRNGDSSIVLASGATPLVPNSSQVILTPFSLAVFGKPRPERQQPGETVEISTFHADKAILEFDRAINSPNDMNRAKLLRLELVSEPEHALPDPRRGVVHITNNQRSTDPNKFMVIRTVGPVFYREPKNNPAPAGGPDIWTDAMVEVIDRQNLPRAYGAPSPPTAPARGADLREPEAVPAILAGKRLPPPTLTALGMKIYLDSEPQKPSANPLPQKPKGSAGFSGVRRVELREQVLINLWVDARQGFVSTPGTGADKGAADRKPGSPLAVPEAPAATAGVVGGVFFASQSARQLDRALLQIETLGPLAYDVEKNLARFDVLPQTDPKLPNDVQVSRITPRGDKQQLFTQVLEIEFNGPPTGGTKPDAPPGARTDSGSSFKQLHAWTYTPGRYLIVSSEDERLEAYGQDLLFEQEANRTTLTGAPLHAVRSNEPRADGAKAGGNVLTAGSPQRPAKLIMEPGPGPEKKMVSRIEGPGKFELFDPASNANTIHATWLTSMTHAKETVNGRELDRLTFIDGARFEDTKADYWLKGKELRLWLETGKKPESNEPTSPLPHRVQATGDVSSHSADFDIENTDFLTVMFREGTPPPEPKVGPPVGPGIPPPAVPMNPLAAANPMNPPPPAEPQKPKPKPPLKLKARIVDTWVVRYPVKKDEKTEKAAKDAKAKPGAEKPADLKEAAQPSAKYELEKARCEGQVVVHQDPDDPEKPRGLDIIGESLIVDHTPQGSVMTVTGSDKKPGEVHHENMSILGPKVVIDQLHNKATVEGRGALSMPAGSDLSGNELKQPEMLVVHWRDSMTFSGSMKTAEFVGKVAAAQGESWVVCHTLQVTLDRPVYFNQLGKPPEARAAAPKSNGPPDPKGPKTNDKDKEKAKDKETAKVEKVFCYPAPDDDKDEPKGSNTVSFHQVERDETNKIVRTQQLTAREIEVDAQAQDDGRGEKYQRVKAHAPGTVRIWQPGQKDMTAPTGQPPQGMGNPQQGNPPQGNPMANGNNQKGPELEMKLTVVEFRTGWMMVKDKGKLYQEATFTGDIEVLHIPADNPEAKVDPHRLPPRSMQLTCTDRLIVSTHKPKDGPPVQRMDAIGNAFIRSDEYDGWGEVIIYDGRFVVLEGQGPVAARIRNRFGGSENSGKRIIYDRVRGNYEVAGGYGATFQNNPTPPRPQPPAPPRPPMR